MRNPHNFIATEKMKTTLGKLEPAPKTIRDIDIFLDGELHTTIKADSLRQACVLFSKGKDGVVIGNTVSVDDKIYIAKEQ